MPPISSGGTALLTMLNVLEGYDLAAKGFGSSATVHLMTEAMRRQYWVNEVFEPITAPALEACYRTVFPNREVKCLAFGVPDLDFDLDRGNAYDTSVAELSYESGTILKDLNLEEPGR